MSTDDNAAGHKIRVGAVDGQGLEHTVPHPGMAPTAGAALRRRPPTIASADRTTPRPTTAPTSNCSQTAGCQILCGLDSQPHLATTARSEPIAPRSGPTA